MKNVMHWFGVENKYLTGGDLGIEIEVEGINLPISVPGWRREEDGSLRGQENAEYVFSKPYTVEQAEKALRMLAGSYVKNNTTVDDSVRAGIHVHVNVQSLSIIELFNFITLYLVLEEVLVDDCGEGRQGNLFCLRAQDAGFLVHSLRKALQSSNFRNLHRDELRYSSMNVKSLGTYGSLEFRAMRGTADMGRVLNWAKILLNLREVAKTYEDPKSIIKGYSDGSAQSFLERCLGEQVDRFLGIDGVMSKIRAGMRRAQDVAYACDWARYVELPTYQVGGLSFPINVQFPDEPLEDF